MGIRGRVPNPEKDQRERKYGWTSIPATAVVEPAPELRLPGHTEAGRAQWERWWAMPVARMWSRVIDADELERLLSMLEQQWAHVPGDKPPPYSEIRAAADRFGLTPAARLRLHWQVEGVDTPATAPDRLGNSDGPAQAVPAAGGQQDPRRLRVVGGQGA